VPAAFSQQAARTVDRPEEPNLVFDDDGGKVQFVPADLSAAAEKKFHGGAVMTQVRQVSIFLGSGWADSQVRERQSTLRDVAAGNAGAPTAGAPTAGAPMAGAMTAGAAMAELRQHKIRTASAAPHVEDFADLSKTTLNDLDIQRRLSAMLESKAIPAPAASTVYVVFLAPEVSSTLGGLKAGTDYLAYHNVVNLEAGEIRYVVVPFHQNAGDHRTAAARAFSETALNPNGQGWF
jgi:hypothetical protein